MLKPRFSVRLKRQFPQEVWSWIYLALKQDALVWDSVENTGLGEHALEAFPASPAAWTPGNLAVLVVMGSLPVEAMNVEPLQPLEATVYDRAILAGREWEHGALTNCDLEKAGLVALYCREFWRKHRSWNEIAGRFPKQDQNLETILAILYGLIPDPILLLQNLLSLSTKEPPIKEVLHAVFSNPMTAEIQLDVLRRIIQPLELRTALQMLRIVNLSRPWISRTLSQEYSQKVETDFPEILLDEEPEKQCDKIRGILNLSELFTLSGQAGQAVKGLNSTITAARVLQGKLAARYARTMNSAGSGSVELTVTQQLQSLVVNAWKHAAQLAPEITEHNSGVVKALISAGQPEQAQEFISQLPENSSQKSAPGLLVASASLEDHFGNTSHAFQLAQEALNSIESGSFIDLDDVLILSRLFNKLGLPELVIQAAQHALKLYPANEELLKLSAQSLLLKERPEQAIINIYSIIAAEDASLENDNSLEQNEILQRMVIDSLERMGDWDSALSDRSDLLSQNSNPSPEDWHGLANCALRAGQPDLASEACGKALEINKDDAIAYQLLGETSLALGDLPEAIIRFQKSVHIAPTLPAGWLTLAKTYRLSGEQGQMLQTLRSASLALPETPEIHLALGEAYLEQDEPTQALPSLRRAASLAITPQIALRLGQTLLKLGHLEEARKVLERALKVGLPESHELEIQLPGQGLSEQEADLHLVYARTLRAQDESTRAIPIYELVVRSFPDRLEPRLNLAKALIESSASEENTDRAIILLREILGIEQKSGDELANVQAIHNEARLLLAENLAQKGSFAESLIHYRQVLDRADTYRPNELTRIASGFASVALALNEPEQALALLKEAALTDPRNPILLKLQSEAYRANGFAEESFEAARMVLELTPSDLENLVWFIEQASFLQAMGGTKKIPISAEVARALDYATQLAPTRADLLLRLGRALQESGDRFAAAEVYRRLASLDCMEYHIALRDLVTAAQALRSIGDAQMSVELLNRILDQMESDSSSVNKVGLGSKDEILSELSRSQYQAGDINAALESLDAAVAEQPEHVQLFLDRADLLQEMGSTEAALENLASALQLEPANFDVQFRIAAQHKRIGRFSEALLNSDRAVQIAMQLQNNEALHSARLLSAELAVTLLRIQQAWEYLHADLSGDEKSCDHLEHGFLRAEMALDAREIELAEEELEGLNHRIEGENSFVVAQFQADRSRLAFLRKDFEQADRQFALAMQVLDGDAPKIDAISTGNQQIEQVACLKGVSRAALELGKWDTAMNISRRLTFLAPHEPASHLQLVQVIVKRAEAQLLYQDLEVKKNAIGSLALSEEVRNEFYSSIDSAIRSSKSQDKAGLDLQNPLGDKSLPHPIKLWYARGLAAFDPSSSSAFLLGNELRETGSRPNELAALLTVFRRLGENASVIKAVENFEKKDPAGNRMTSDPVVQIQMALALEEAEPQKGISILQDALVAMSEDDPLNWPDAPMLNYLTSRLAARAGYWSIAQAAIQDALMSWPDEARWHSQAARIFLSEDPDGDLPDITQAIHHLEASIRYEPENEWSYKSLGQIYLDREEYARASQLLEKAVQLSPGDLQVWQVLAQVQLRSGLLDAAAKSAESALKIDPDSIEAALLRAEIALQANNPRGAIKRLEEILKSDPENVHALHLLAICLEALDRNEEAMAAIEKAIRLDTDPTNLLTEKIKLVRKLEGFDAGLHFLQEKIQQHPRNIQLVVLLSDWLFEAGNQQSAVQVAQAVLQSNHYKLTPKQISELHFRTGFQMRRTGQLDQALHHLSKSIEFSPNYLEAYLELGRAYQDQRAYQQALRIFQKAISVAPNDYRPYYLAGQAMKEGKDFPNAEAMLRKAAHLAPDEVGVHRLLGAVVVLNLVHSRRIASNEIKRP